MEEFYHDSMRLSLNRDLPYATPWLELTSGQSEWWDYRGEQPGRLCSGNSRFWGILAFRNQLARVGENSGNDHWNPKAPLSRKGGI